MRVCDLCGKPIVLVPSAKERAAKVGGRPEDYTALFTRHPDCHIAERNRTTIELMRAIAARNRNAGTIQQGVRTCGMM